MKRTGYLRSALALLGILCVLSCPAQHRERLPDSVSTSEDDLPADRPRSAGTDIPPSTDTTVTTTVTVGTAEAGKDTAVPAAPLPVFLRSVPEPVITRYKNDRNFAYANDPAYWKEEPLEKPNRFMEFLGRFFGSKGFRIFLYLLLGALLLFAFYKIIAENKLYLFYRPSRATLAGSGAIEFTDLRDEDLDQKIQEALQTGDRRLGTRYLFLKTLRLLDERELIRYQPKATNQDYLLQMAAHPQSGKFRFLTGAYEYVWYGDFTLSGVQFEGLMQEFQDFYKTIATRN